MAEFAAPPPGAPTVAALSRLGFALSTVPAPIRTLPFTGALNFVSAGLPGFGPSRRGAFLPKFLKAKRHARRSISDRRESCSISGTALRLK
jgi:hypothetical protein